MSVGKQIPSAWSLLLSGLVFLLVAFLAAAQDVTRAPGDTARSAMAPVPASAKSALAKDAVRPVKATHPEATPMPAIPKQAAKSHREDPPSERLPASQLGMGCAEDKNQ
jgi:hypothetical protein